MPVWKRLIEEESGQDLVEYTLLVAFIGLAGAAAYIGTGVSMNTLWTVINSRLAAAKQ